MSKSPSHALGTALVTGASAGIGAAYADRLARRGYDLILVARSQAKLEALAERLRRETGVTARVLKADLTLPNDVRRVESVLAADPAITLLVNNAGVAGPSGFANANVDAAEAMIDLNVRALVRLSGAVIPGFLARGSGAIINIASVLAYGAEVMPGVYSATKAFVVNFSQGLQHELGGRGLYVQAVLPAATRTDIWEQVGITADDLPAGSVMDVGDMVDAALVGFDQGERVTLPSLHDQSLWTAMETARLSMMQRVRSDRPAPRYATPETTPA
jgi:short-subunit dehydrogenase